MDIKVIRFSTVYAVGKPDADWVEFTSKDAIDESGNPRHSTWENIKRIQPPEYIDNDDGGLKMAALRSQWAQIEPSYLAWKQGMSMPETGTPLGAWAGVNVDQANALRGIGIKSVEAVANCSEGLLANAPLPNMRDIKRQAAIWLEGQDKAGLTAQLADLEAKNAAMLEMLAEMQADKPKRGRPAKIEEATEEEAA